MAIIKKAKNIRIKVYGKDTIVAGKYTQIAEEIKIESLAGDISLSSMKKITSVGNKKL